MKTVGIFTTTRAEFGLFQPLLQAIENSLDIAYKLFVGGAHLADEYGRTAKEIENSTFLITEKFDYLLNMDDPRSLVQSSAIECFQLAEIYEKYQFDFTCLLGDRIELLPIVINSIIFNKPIIHIHGGEISEGAIDEQIRHMVTKSAHVHFVACEEYASNIKRMGEEEFRVFNTGALAVDNMLNLKMISKDELFRKINLNTDIKTVLLTHHPSILEDDYSASTKLDMIFKALSQYNLQVVITEPGAEEGRTEHMDFLRKKAKSNRNYHIYSSLGMQKYLSLLNHCEFIIGNSSSGIIEAPFFKVPSINIGERQRGRIRHPSVIDATYNIDSITHAIDHVLTPRYKNTISNFKYKFGEGNSAKRMINILKRIEINRELKIKKLSW